MNGSVILKDIFALVTCDSNDNVYNSVDVFVENGEIKEIGKNIDKGVDEVIDCSNYIIYPGLVNTHHHFFQTFVRNRQDINYPMMTVIEWLDKIYKIFQNIDEDMIYYSTMTALSDLIKHGCTTAFDHQYCYTKKSGTYLIDRQMEAAGQLGIRYHGGRGTNTLPREKGSTIPDNMRENTVDFIKDCERLIDKYNDNSKFSMQNVVIAPCQPINCYEDTFIESVNLAKAKNARLHTHLGEGENDQMFERWGKRTLEWCEERGFIGENVWYAHCWELEKDEYLKMASTKTGLSHCPNPAVLGGFPILDLKELKEQGVILSLGCDGSATNDGSNLLDSVRLAYLMQTFHSKQRGGCVDAYDILKMATVGGAKTLGRDDIGDLSVGKAADLFAIDINKLELSGSLHDPKNLIARLGLTGEVKFTMVGGNTIFKDGELLNVDEIKLAEKANLLYKKL
ncbi:amidohydrolase [Miniphocaeibacter massiliensis]|uniref:amidohydrolase n=1 Tax=Miniphocaeibacter massiliensis TaxID=2041841 RepID=UPI000C1C6F4B|nr:amidohydrolase [Miniphocaeibacter massiliensis]